MGIGLHPGTQEGGPRGRGRSLWGLSGLGVGLGGSWVVVVVRRRRDDDDEDDDDDDDDDEDDDDDDDED
eukprot:2748191-Karenia_brevis.AAC.1